MSLTRRSLVATALVAATILLAQQPAAASTPLADATVITASAAGDYTFSTTTNYWSVVAVGTAADYDLRLYDGGTTLLGQSTYGTGRTDFVAVNSNLRALGAYRASVSLYSGSGNYFVEQRQGHTVTTLPTPANDGVSGPGDRDLAFATVQSQDVISVSDVYLSAGEAFWVNTSTVDGDFFFLESNPAGSATFVRSRTQAAAVAGTRQAQGCTLYTANYTGWHGLVVVNPDAPHATSPQQGTAYALHRYDPARPNTCPQRNFPAPTPAGP